MSLHQGIAGMKEKDKVDFLTEFDKDDLFGGHALTDPIKTVEV